MGTALLKGILTRQNADSHPQVQLAACVQSTQSLARIENILGDHSPQVALGSGNEFAVQITEQAQVVILGVRPGDFAGLLQVPGLAEALATRIVVSMLAGVTLQDMARTFGVKGISQDLRLLKLMPTIGAQNGDSVSLLVPSRHADPNDVTLVRELFSLVGSVTDISEDLIDAGVAVGATCHALSLVAVDTITDAGVSKGLPRSLAATLARRSLQSALGVLDSGMSIEQLKEALSTPSGITLNSVVNLEKAGVRGGIAENTQKAITYACDGNMRTYPYLQIKK